MQEINITGEKYGRLLVVNKTNTRDKFGRKLYLCRCECGNEIFLPSSPLRRKNTQSCGCLFKEKLINRITTHKKSQTLTYRVWQDIKDRCLNPKHHSYKNYGGRGIKLQKSWLKFENFLKDMGKKPYGLSIDRFNNNKGYYKKNCQWATKHTQSRNRRNNVLITFNGKTQCLSDWAKEINISQPGLWARLYIYKFPLEKALSKKRYG